MGTQPVSSVSGQPTTAPVVSSEDEGEIFNSAMLDALQQRSLQLAQMTVSQHMEIIQESVQD